MTNAPAAIPFAVLVLLLPAIAIGIAVTAIAFFAISGLVDWLSPKQEHTEHEAQANTYPYQAHDLRHASTR